MRVRGTHMAEKQQTPTSGTSQTTRKSELSVTGAMPYVIGALLICGAMAWYFFVFVPTQLEYYAGSRFRTLAVAGGQVQSKIESLQKALDGVRSIARTDIEAYLKVVIPDIQLVTTATSTSDLRLTASHDNTLSATI